VDSFFENKLENINSKNYTKGVPPQNYFYKIMGPYKEFWKKKTSRNPIHWIFNPCAFT
jgi:hypothetical protein